MSVLPPISPALSFKVEKISFTSFGPEKKALK